MDIFPKRERTGRFVYLVIVLAITILVFIMSRFCSRYGQVSRQVSGLESREKSLGEQIGGLSKKVKELEKELQEEIEMIGYFEDPSTRGFLGEGRPRYQAKSGNLIKYHLPGHSSNPLRAEIVETT